MKNILLICPKFFGYEKYIKSNLRKRGYNVYIIFENICEYNLFFKIFTKYINYTKRIVINLYYKFKLAIIPHNFDYLFVIRGSSISKDILAFLERKKFSKKVMYQWDSVENNINALNIKGFFDSISTFDYQDAVNNNWKYRPLFYIDILIPRNSVKNNIDILFLGSVHSERMCILREIEKIQNKTIFARLYTQKQSFIKNKLLRTHLYDSKNITTNSMSLKNVYDLYSRTNVVIDYTHPKQKGITIRSIEAIGNNCKLVTNNPNIKKESFYDDKNIYVYKDVNELVDILSRIDYCKNTNYESKTYYGIDKWIESILLLDN